MNYLTLVDPFFVELAIFSAGVLGFLLGHLEREATRPVKVACIVAMAPLCFLCCVAALSWGRL